VDRHFQFNVMERYRGNRQTVESIGNSCRTMVRQAGGWDETRRRESIRHMHAAADSFLQRGLHVAHDGLGRSVWRRWVQYRMQYRLRYGRLRHLLHGRLWRPSSLVELETWLWRMRQLWGMWFLRRSSLRPVLTSLQRDSRSIPRRSGGPSSLPSDADQRGSSRLYPLSV
jgi:hypothetical protein